MAEESSLIKVFDGCGKLIDLINGRKTAADTPFTLFELEILRIFKEYKALQAQLSKLKEENRWIPADELPQEFISRDKNNPVNWERVYMVLEYEDTIPRPMTAECIWLDEGSEVEWYKPITLPQTDAEITGPSAEELRPTEKMKNELRTHEPVKDNEIGE